LDDQPQNDAAPGPYDAPSDPDAPTRAGDLEEFSLAEYPAAPVPADEYPFLDDTIDAGVTPAAADKPASPGRTARLSGRLRGAGAGLFRTRRRKLATGAAVALVAVLAVGTLVVIPRMSGSGSAAGTVPAMSPVAAVPTATGSPSGAVPSGSQSGMPIAATRSPLGTSDQTSSPRSIPTQTAPTAAITFTNVVLDADNDPNRTTRTFIFASDGPGAVSAEIVSSSPSDTSRICLAVDDAAQACQEGVAPGFTSIVAPTDHSRWTVTLTSADHGSPTVDIAFRWPSRQPLIWVMYGRFQGSPNPDSVRSLQATFKARTTGRLTLEASWGATAFAASVSLADVSATRSVTVDQVTYPAAMSVSPSYSHPIATGKTYRVELLNGSPDASRPNLTATIAFP
jgi:hypothetical protein